MTAARSASGIVTISVFLLLGLPARAWAHAFGERYDLPLPLTYFVAGAAAAVALSFVIAAIFARRAPRDDAGSGVLIPLGPVLPVLRIACRTSSVVLLWAIVAAGLIGNSNPELNLAPVLVWIIWWVGLSLVVACIGNIWPAFDPWRTMFEWAGVVARRVGLNNGAPPRLTYPTWLGAWPAVVLLLVFVWIEVIYPDAVAPRQLAWMILVWTTVTLAGMVCFGGAAWRCNADMFAIYFGTLGRFAPIAPALDGKSVFLRPPGRGLIDRPARSFAMVGFVLAMLATVFFDGLLSTQVLALLHRALTVLAPGAVDDRGYILGTLGLVCVWLLFLGLYLVSCLATAGIAHSRNLSAVALPFALTLVPIAIAYNVAHYFSYLAVKGQWVIPRISDPLGLKWDLFGTASFSPDIGIIDARFSWYLAISSIVIGHIISIWLAHRVALREFRAPRRAAIASVPLTLLMMIFTAISLLVMAEPLVQFTQPELRP